MTTSVIAEFRQAALISSLRRCPLFSGLSGDELNNIAALTLPKSISKGEYLFRQGEPSAGFYIVQRGGINLHRVNALGKEQVIHVFRAGESFAEGTLANDGGYPADAKAVEDTHLLLVQKAGFVALFKRQPELGLRMLGAMSLHLRSLVGQIEDLTLHDVETRLAHWLVQQCPDVHSSHPHPIQLPMTKRLLAAELGTVSETFSRTLGKFRDQKLIYVDGKTITVTNPARLAGVLRQRLGEAPVAALQNAG